MARFLESLETHSVLERSSITTLHCDFRDDLWEYRHCSWYGHTGCYRDQKLRAMIRHSIGFLQNRLEDSGIDRAALSEEFALRALDSLECPYETATSQSGSWR